MSLSRSSPGTFGSLVLTAVLAVTLRLQHSALINHDTAWYLYSAGEFLDGGRLYVDMFFDVNPPLGLWLTLPASLLSRWTGIPATETFVCYLTILICGSLALTRRILLSTPTLTPMFRRGLLFAALIALTLCAIPIFGQREHFLMVFVVPYLTLAACRATGGSCARTPAVIIGVLAGLGFALKPHFFLVPAGVELYLLGSAGIRGAARTENCWAVATVALYGVTVLVLTPEYVDRVVPYGLAVYNAAFKNSWALVLRHKEVVLLPVVLAFHLAVRRRLEYVAFADVFLIAATALFVVYLVQMKGWPYHIYPTSAALVLALGAMLSTILAGAGRSRRSLAGAAISKRIVTVAASICFTLIGSTLVVGGYRSEDTDRWSEIVRQHATGSTIYAFTSRVSLAFPLVTETGIGWSSRFPTLWLLPGLERRLRSADPESSASDIALLAEIEQYVRDAVLADLTATSPELVLVDTRRHKTYFAEIDFNYIDYFSEDSRFAALWTNYDEIQRYDDVAVYRLRHDR
jgi:hypothetical protein